MQSKRRALLDTQYRVAFNEPEECPNRSHLNPGNYAIPGAVQEQVYHGRKFDTDADGRAGVARTATALRWRYVALVVVPWCWALSSSSASVTALR